VNEQATDPRARVTPLVEKRFGTGNEVEGAHSFSFAAFRACQRSALAGSG
jgi:hypothetical protein